jgi:hypothetical protein
VEVNMIEGLMIRIKRVYETPSMEDRVKTFAILPTFTWG